MKTIQASVSGKKQTGRSGRRWGLRLGLFGIFVICIVVFSYILVRNDSYSVETSLLYISGHEVAGEAAKLSLSQEIHLLKTPQISSLLAGEIYGFGPRAATGQEKPAPAKAAAESGPPILTPPVHARFGNKGQFTKWLSEGLSTEEEILSRGLVKVTLRLQGDDPNLLSSILTSYVSQYLDYRRSLEPEKKENTADAVLNPPSVETHESAVPEAPDKELQKLDADQQSYKVALQLIDSDKGVFRGFIPDEQILGMSLLSRLQDRIIRLQIHKEALFVSFYPESREIRRSDEEIRDLRNDLREFLAEMVRFSQKRKEILLAQTRAAGVQMAKAPKIDTPPTALCGPQPPDTGALFVSSDGISVFWQKSSITRKPFLLRAKQYIKGMATKPWGTPKT
jgi:hypothetical protein